MICANTLGTIGWRSAREVVSGLPAVSISVLFFLVIIVAAPLSAWAVTIPTVLVGNVGNANDPNSGNVFGGVAYAYRIGTTEVTNAQYIDFLNAKASSDPLDLYNPSMGSESIGGISRSGVSGSYTYAAKTDMADKPVNYVSWYDAIRFANWLNNGQGAGDTETGAYTLTGGTPIPSNGDSITRNAGATVFLPSENEWYKAAYFNPATSSYFLYPTSSDTVPNAAFPTATPNSANWNSGVPGSNGPVIPTDVGAYTGSASPFGAYDMGGNLWEWNETYDGGTGRGVRGGSFGGDSFYMQSTHQDFEPAGDPVFDGLGTGFRIAAIPEPSTALLGLFGCAMAWVLRKRFK